MSSPVTPRDPRKALASMARTSLIVAIVTTVLAVGCLAYAAIRVVDAASQSADEMSATVESVGEHNERRGGRRSRRMESVRHVTVVTKDGTSGLVDSEDLQVGDTTQVWVDGDGEISLEDPSSLGFGNLLVPGLLLLGGLLLALIAVGSWRRIGLRSADIDAAPRLVLELDEEKLKSDPTRIKDGHYNLPLRAVESDTPKFPVGRDGNLSTSQSKSPVDLSQGIPRTWEGRLLHTGMVMSVFAVRRSADDPWWVTDL